jgi:hypothetical protein
LKEFWHSWTLMVSQTLISRIPWICRSD